ncbi:MAG TPA: regulator, partial [Vicinamibacteria bacterium]|nr:regulator [Vicinamibacteria bacterium]
MSALSWLDPGSVSALGWTLVHFVWQGAAAAAVLAAANALLAGRSPRARYAAALATLLAMLALPLATFAVLRAGPAAPPGDNTTAVPPAPGAEARVGAEDAARAVMTAPPADLMPALVTAWAAGVGLLS